jgi:hypothetical protein
MLRRSIASLERRAAYDRRVREIDRERGFVIRAKYIFIAYAVEIAIIIASLIGQYLLSRHYDGGNYEALALMMVTPIVYAVIELVRVPLAIAARTQRSRWIKLLAIFGVLLAAVVTVKSLSQLGEQMFHPRLEAVNRAKQEVKLSNAERDSFSQKVSDADAVVSQRMTELAEIEDRSKSLTEQLGTVAKPQCTTLSGRNAKGSRWQQQKCTPDPKGEIIQGNLKQAQADRAIAAEKVDVARAERSKFDRIATDTRVANAEKALRQAVMDSQLHSFAAMLFAIDPSEVTDAQVHEFLRLFVFIPAICASLAATILASAAVEIIPPDERETVSLPADAGIYALGGLAEHLVNEAIQGVQQTAKGDIAAGIVTAQTDQKAAVSQPHVIPLPTPASAAA